MSLSKSDRMIEMYYEKKGEEVKLEIPALIDEESQEQFVSLADILKAEQTRIAKKNNVTPLQTFELLTLYAPALSRTPVIKQKFRFNKILFYIGKKIEEEFGINGLLFDEMNRCRAGPIPKTLRSDLEELEAKKLIEIYVENNGKKIPESRNNWPELIRTRKGACVAKLTPKGEGVASTLWSETKALFGDELMDIIQAVKKELIYMDTEKLKEKVHQEYPEWRKIYIEEDNEDYCSASLS